MRAGGRRGGQTSSRKGIAGPQPAAPPRNTPTEPVVQLAGETLREVDMMKADRQFPLLDSGGIVLPQADFRAVERADIADMLIILRETALGHIRPSYSQVQAARSFLNFAAAGALAGLVDKPPDDECDCAACQRERVARARGVI